MADIALITEGITDQIVIRNILYGYLGDPDIVINPLQPLVDETDKSRMTGGWSEVMRAMLVATSLAPKGVLSD